MKRKFSRKLIAFTLFLLICISSMPIPAFGDEEEVSVVTVSENLAVSGQSLLTGLDMLDEPQADLNAPLSRGDFAKLLADMMRYTEHAVPESGYRDVEGVEHEQAINFAVEQGYMVGDKGLFRPEDGVTYAEALRGFVELTGQNLRKENLTETGYIMKASGLGITRRIEAKNGNSLVSAGAIYAMAANTLKAPSVKMDSIGTEGITATQSGDFLEVMYDIRRTTALLTKTRYAGIYTAEGAGKNSIMLDQIRFKAEEDWSEYLGYTVTAYIDFGGVEAEVLHLVPAVGNAIVELKSEDIISVNSSKTEIVYTLGDQTDDDEEKMVLNNSTRVVWNGAAGGTIVAYTPNQLSLRSDAGHPKTGSVRLIDYDDDGVCDVMIIMSYDIYYVDTVDERSERIIDETADKIFDMSAYPSYNRFITYESGGEADFESFDKELLLHVATSRNGMVKIIIGEQSVEATVSGVRDNGGVEEYLVDGVWYRGNDYFYDNFTLRMGWHGYFLLDADGRIAVLQTQSSMKNAYLINISKGIGLSTETQAQMLSNYKTDEAAYEVQVFEFAPKVSVDRYGTGAFTSYNEEDIRALFLKTPEGPGLTDFNHQLVKYQVNNNGEITALQAADTSGSWSATELTGSTMDSREWFNESAEFALSYNARKGGIVSSALTADNTITITAPEAYSNASTIGDKFVVDGADALLWVIPPENQMQEVNLFECGSLSDFAIESNPDLKIYDLKEDGTISNVVWQMKEVVIQETKWQAENVRENVLLVDDIKSVLAADGTVTKEISGYRFAQNSNEKQGYLSFRPYLSNGLDDIKDGDLIFYKLDSKNRIIDTLRIYSYEDGCGYAPSTGDNRYFQIHETAQRTYYGYNHPFLGKILYESINGVTLTFPEPTYGKTALSFSKTTYFEWIVYDTETGEAHLDKTPAIYSVLDVDDPDDATDALVLYGGARGMAMGVLYVK